MTRIIAISLTALGDHLLCLPAIDALRAAHPDARIGFLARPQCQSLFADYPALNETMGVDIPQGKTLSGFKTLFRIFAAVVRFAPTTAYIFACSPDYLIPILRLAGVRRIYMVPNEGRFRWMLTNSELSKENGWDLSEHGAEDRLRAVRAGGVPAPLGALNLPVRPAWTAEARLWLSARGWDGKDVVVFQVAAGLNHPTKILPGIRRRHWPRDRFAAVGRALAKEFPNSVVVVTGSPDERDAAEEVVRLADHSRIATSAGELSLGGVAGLLASARLVLTPDTGIMHLAHAVHAPTVCLYSLSELHRTRRLDVQVPHQVVQASPPDWPRSRPEDVENCMSFIKTDDVIAACKNVLRQSLLAEPMAGQEITQQDRKVG